MRRVGVAVGVQLLRLGHDQYVQWSDTVDGPVGPVMTRGQMVQRLEGKDLPADQVAELLGALDRTGSSDPTRPLDEALAHNRAGPDETWLSLEEIVRAYARPEE